MASSVFEPAALASGLRRSEGTNQTLYLTREHTASPTGGFPVQGDYLMGQHLIQLLPGGQQPIPVCTVDHKDDKLPSRSEM